MKPVKLAELVEDFSVYPRMEVNDTHVAHIAEALEAGVIIPAIIIDEKTKRIIDGFHRARAARRVYGEEGEIQAEHKHYASEAELVLDAIRLNAGHGRNMSTADRAHAILIADRVKADNDKLAVALNVTVERVVELRTKYTIKVEDTRKRVPLKFCIRHMVGDTLTREQAEIVPKLGGNNPMFMANEPLIERLRLLASKIGEL